MPGEADFPALRRRAANLSRQEIVAIASQLGWETLRRRGKGSHSVMVKGQAVITITARPKKGTYLAILKVLEQEARRG